MSTNNTHDFDVLVQISESELNDQLKANFLSCDGGVPQRIQVENFETEMGLVTAYVNFDEPTMELGDSTGEVKIILPVSDSLVRLNDFDFDFTGSITVTHSIEVYETASSASFGLDFRAEGLDIEVDTDNEILNTGIESIVGLARDQLASIGRIDFTQEPIPLSNSDTFTPSKVAVTTVASPDGNCLTLGLQMANDRSGDISHVDSYMIPYGHSVAIVISSYWLLAHVLRPEFAQALEVPLGNVEKPLKLIQPISIPGVDATTLTKLEAEVIGESIHVSGHISRRIIRVIVLEFGFSFDLNFEIDVNEELQPTTRNLDINMALVSRPFVAARAKADLQDVLEDLTSKSYSLGVLAEGFKIVSLQLDRNLILHADVKKGEIPENHPFVSIQAGWTEAPETRKLPIPGSYSQDVILHGEFEASDCRAALPIEYNWSFNDEVLEQGQNRLLDTSNGTLTYDLEGQLITLKANTEGQQITGTLCVTAVDARGRELSDCIDIDKSGSVHRDDGRLNPRLPDIWSHVMQDWVDPIPVNPMQHEITHSDVVKTLIEDEGIRTVEELRLHLNLTRAQMAERLNMSQADYRQYQMNKRLR